MGYANYRGKSFCVGVRYFTVPFPIYIGAILRGVHKIISMIRTPMQHCSYKYRNSFA